MIFFSRVQRKFYLFFSYFFYKPFLKKSGKRLLIINPIILSAANIEIGDNFFLRNNGRLEAVDNYYGVKFYPLIVLGNNVSIEQNLHLTCAEFIKIGDNTAIANNVTITDIDHPYLDISTIIEHQIIKTKAVSIGEGCKIFSNAVILQGVHLGCHTVVAANSVVKAGVYPNYCVIAGSPAKVIKKYNLITQLWEKV